MIELKYLSKTFQMKDGAVKALQNINLTIPDGSIYGIIGMSGAGKSTLVRCINLLERPTGGSVVIDGVAMETLSPASLRKRRREITMIFQQFNLLMQRTCLKNVCFPMELAGVKKAEAEKRAMELLEMVGLPDKANAYPAQLSGGQKQRIAIARALATNPKVLLCDEATSALDPNTTHSILTLIKDINRKLGITVVVITHQMSVVEEICDSVAILDGGVVVEQGSVQEIFANPKTAAAKRLVAPNGGSAARDLSCFAPDDHVVRVTFNGSSTAKPLVASLAAEKGISVKTAREMDRMEGELQRANAEKQRAEQMRAAAEHQQRVAAVQAQWQAEAERLQQKYPSFALDEVLNNPAVADMIRRGIGLEAAYRAAYFDQLMENQTAQTAKQVEQGVAARIQQRGQCPTENGVRPGGAAETKVDVEHMTRAQRAELARRARRGERIVL